MFRRSLANLDVPALQSASMYDALTTSAERPANTAQVRPVPVRYWWLKRILFGCGVILIGLVALRIWWGWEANRRLQAGIDGYIAAGEPVYPEDFDQSAVPDDQNAAKMYDDAAAALLTTTKPAMIPGCTHLTHAVSYQE